jgi:hypothetical protein
MSTIEDEIRDTLRSEAARLREVRPLDLPAALAPREPQAGPGPLRAWPWRAWLVPATAAAAVVLVAATLVTLRSLGTSDTAAPAATPSPIAGPGLGADVVPRYYVQVGFQFGSARSRGPAIFVGDEKAKKTIATVPLLPKGQYTILSITDTTVTGAADDRTFVVSASVRVKGQVVLPITWYLVRIFPGTADPVRVTRLRIEFPASSAADSLLGWHVDTTALSGDGTELAVVAADDTPSDKASPPDELQVYSVATGRLQHSWPAGIDQTEANNKPISDLSWVGDTTVGFAVTYTPAVREEVRTLDVSASGGSLFTDSRVVWSQYVPAPQLTPEEKATTLALEPTPHACDTPFLTANGQAVICGNATYSAADKRLSAVWLAYPLATPTRPRVLGQVQEPRNVSALDGPVSVDWANPSGTEVIGTWNPTVITGPSDNPVSTTSNDEAYIGHGTVTPFPYLNGGIQIAW